MITKKLFIISALLFSLSAPMVQATRTKEKNLQDMVYSSPDRSHYNETNWSSYRSMRDELEEKLSSTKREKVTTSAIYVGMFGRFVKNWEHEDAESLIEFASKKTYQDLEAQGLDPDSCQTAAEFERDRLKVLLLRQKYEKLFLREQAGVISQDEADREAARLRQELQTTQKLPTIFVWSRGGEANIVELRDTVEVEKIAEVEKIVKVEKIVPVIEKSSLGTEALKYGFGIVVGVGGTLAAAAAIYREKIRQAFI